jgi:hypothetical protein
VTSLSGLNTTEAGGTAVFTIVLDAQPSASVTIGAAVSDQLEVVLSAWSLTFAVGEWNIYQTVTVTGVDDVSVDGHVPYSITTGNASSADTNFNGVSVADVAGMVNIDGMFCRNCRNSCIYRVCANTNSLHLAHGVVCVDLSCIGDVAAFTVRVLDKRTTEAGGTAMFSIEMASRPSASVTIGVASAEIGEGLVSSAAVSFMASKWNISQTVTVTGVDDDAVDGNTNYTITISDVSSSDTNYNGVAVGDVDLMNMDGTKETSLTV